MARLTQSFRLLPRPWDPSAPGTGEMGEPGLFTCACCGLITPGRRFPWHGDGPGPVCALCNILQDPTRPAIEREAVLIWWPKLPQTRIMTLTRCAHQTLIQTLGNGPNGQDIVWHRAMDAIASGSDTAMMPAQCKSALAVLRALHARTTEARRRLETTSPRLLATALLMANRADPQINESATALMDGIRLLPLGRLYDGATDVYPALVREWLDADPQPVMT